MDESEIYTSLEDAKKEIWRRWNDKELRKKVEDFLGGDIPEPFKKEPRAVLARPVMTPDIEHKHFLGFAEKIELKPISWEYLQDKFYTINSDKLCLAKMSFFHGRDNNGNNKISVKKIIDFKKSEGKKISDLETLWGENFVEFHHRILKLIHSNMELYDGTDWYKKRGRASADYYVYYLSIFLCHGVLFENFITDEYETKFAKEVVFPAIEQIKKLFNVIPLIVPLAPKEECSNGYWWCYPDYLEDKINEYAV